MSGNTFTHTNKQRLIGLISFKKSVQATGGCLCGTVHYKIRGKRRNIVNCRYSKCRRFHDHFGAYASVPGDGPVLVEDREDIAVAAGFLDEPTKHKNH